MPDPHALYVVAAVVVLGLVAWVIVVLLGPSLNRAPAEGAASDPAKPPASPPPGKGEPPASSEQTERRRLDPHEEISDDVTLALDDFEEEEMPTAPNGLILVTAVGRTDPGLKRTHNEDSYAILEHHRLFVIADGMGRHAAGEVASRLCVEAITEAFRTSTFGPVNQQPSLPRRAARLRGAILLANERILSASRKHEAYAGMGTTVVSIYFSPNNERVYVAHVGDSRCYRLRAGKLTQLTTDHTLAAVGVQGKIAGMLSRAVGVEDHIDVDFCIESPRPHDIYLLCSDGLSRMVQDEEIQQTLVNVKSLDEATKLLVDKANQSGGRDNITAILVRVDDAKYSSAHAPNAASVAST